MQNADQFEKSTLFWKFVLTVLTGKCCFMRTLYAKTIPCNIVLLEKRIENLFQ
jgi:hypothetical protein